MIAIRVCSQCGKRFDAFGEYVGERKCQRCLLGEAFPGYEDDECVYMPDRAAPEDDEEKDKRKKRRPGTRQGRYTIDSSDRGADPLTNRSVRVLSRSEKPIGEDERPTVFAAEDFLFG